MKLSRISEPLPVVVLAIVAGYGSFSHIASLAERSGQEGAMAWATAVAIDLVMLVAAREIRRDRKMERKSVLPLVILVGGIALSLLANIAEAPPTVWGKVMAATPAVALLAAVSLLERRAVVGASGRALDPRAAMETKKVVVVPQTKVNRPRRAPKPAAVDDDILGRARRVAEVYRQEQGRPISRDQLKQRLGISTQRATLLRRELRAVGV